MASTSRTRLPGQLPTRPSGRYCNPRNAKTKNRCAPPWRSNDVGFQIRPSTRSHRLHHLRSSHPFHHISAASGQRPCAHGHHRMGGPIWSTFTIHNVVREGSILHVNMHATYARQGGRIDPIDRVNSNFVAIEEIPPRNYLLDDALPNTLIRLPNRKPQSHRQPDFPRAVQGRWLLEKDICFPQIGRIRLPHRQRDVARR